MALEIDPDATMAYFAAAYPRVSAAGIGRVRRALDAFIAASDEYDAAHEQMMASIPATEHLDYAGSMRAVREAEEAASAAYKSVVRDVVGEGGYGG